MLQASTWDSGIRAQSPPATLQALMLDARVFTCATDWKSKPGFQQSKARGRNGKAEGTLWRREQFNFSFEIQALRARGRHRQTSATCWPCNMTSPRCTHLERARGKCTSVESLTDLRELCSQPQRPSAPPSLGADSVPSPRLFTLTCLRVTEVWQGDCIELPPVRNGSI